MLDTIYRDKNIAKVFFLELVQLRETYFGSEKKNTISWKSNSAFVVGVKCKGKKGIYVEWYGNSAIQTAA